MRSPSVCLCPKFLHSASNFCKSDWGRIAGGNVFFSHAEVIDRASGTRTLAAYDELKASGDTCVLEALRRIEAPRPSILGLDMTQSIIMGIVNVTPDSFSDGGEFATADRAIARGRTLVEEGAHILDIGGESTRPGSDEVDAATELSRILPVIKSLSAEGMLISCDTRKSEVMREAASAGALIVNDVSGLTHDESARVTVAELQMPVVLMHSRGEPKVMQNGPAYKDVCLEVFETLETDIARCVEAGIPHSHIVADPGIGFGKTFDHNLELLHNLAIFHGLGVPVMLGVSRKGFLGALTGVKDAGQRAVGSVSAALMGLAAGIQFFRVHDVSETVEAFAVWKGIARRSVH